MSQRLLSSSGLTGGEPPPDGSPAPLGGPMIPESGGVTIELRRSGLRHRQDDMTPRGELSMRRPCFTPPDPPSPAPLRGGPSLSQPSLSRPPSRPPGERGLKQCFFLSFCQTNHSLFSRRTWGRPGEEGRGDEGQRLGQAIWL